jgi:1-acyl-sn-glycerol-3-phosphate acyltransferase
MRSRVRELASESYRYAATLQGWTLFGGLTLGLGVALIPPTLAVAPLWPDVRQLFSDVTHRALALYGHSVMYMRIRVEGRERQLPGPRILVANHSSWLDPLVLMGIEPRLGGPVRRYMLGVPIFGAIARLSGFFPSEIGEPPSFEEMRDAVALARARGGSLLFFPEGTRSQNGELGSFHRGAFRAAFDHEIPIQPVAIEGLDRVLPRRGPIVQTRGRSLVRVRYLAPIEPPFESAGLRRDTVRALAERTRAAISDELSEMRRDVGVGVRAA